MLVAAAVAGITPVAAAAANASILAPPDPAATESTNVETLHIDLTQPWPDQHIFCRPDAVSCIYPSPDSAVSQNPDGSGTFGVIDRWPAYLPPQDSSGQPDVVGSTLAP
jgi:hypothetical protein